MSAAARRSIEDQELEAFVDEMLPPEASAEISTALKTDGVARGKVEAHRHQRLMLRLLYEHVIRQHVPQRMRRMIEEARAKARRRRKRQDGSSPENPNSEDQGQDR